MNRFSHHLCHSGFRSLLLLAAIYIAAYSAAPVAAQDMPQSFLDVLPRKAVDVTMETRQLIERLARTDSLAQRVHGVQWLGAMLPLDSVASAQLENLLRKTIDESDVSQLLSIAPMVAHFPSLHDKLLRKVDEPRAKDIVLWQLATSVDDFELARGFAGEIESMHRRRNAIQKLADRAPSLGDRLEFLEELFLLRLESDPSMNGAVFALLDHAAEDPQAICDFIDRNFAADHAMRIYPQFARRAINTSAAAARLYMDAAWSRVDDTAEPYTHVPRLARQPALALHCLR